MVKQKFNIALNINSEGLFILPKVYLKHTTFKPQERIAITFAKKFLFVIPADRRHYNASYYTYLLDNGSMYLKTFIGIIQVFMNYKY